MQLQALETVLEHDPAAARAQLAEAEGHRAQRDPGIPPAIQSLRATPLQDLGIAEALRQLARRQAERSDMAVELEVAEVGVLDPLTEQAIYRVAEAALANIEEHAAATELAVRLAEAGCGRWAGPGGQRQRAGVRAGQVPVDRLRLLGMAERADADRRRS